MGRHGTLLFAAVIACMGAWSSAAYGSDCRGPGRQIDTDRYPRFNYSHYGGRLLVLSDESNTKPYVVESECLLLNDSTFWFGGRRPKHIQFALVNYVPPSGAPESAAILVQGIRARSTAANGDILNIYRNENWIDAAQNVLPELKKQSLDPDVSVSLWNDLHLRGENSLEGANDALGRPLHAWLVNTISSWQYHAELVAGVPAQESRTNYWLTTELIRFGVNTTARHKSFIPFWLGIEGEGDLILKITSTLSGFTQSYTLRIE